MLALVHPFNPSPDTPHRTPSSNRSRTPHHRKSTPTSRDSSSSSSFSASSSYSSYIAPKTTSSLPMNGSASSSRHTSQPIVNRQLSTTAHPVPSTAPVEEPKAASTTIPKPAEPTPAAENSFDIHSYPPPDLLRLLASLLTQIASTNDKLDAGSSSNVASSSAIISDTNNPVWRSLTTASRSALSTHSSTLTFHARNIPTISLEAYLLRILKYCPTTNEVFLSLLVYFDRMTKLTSEATGRSFVIDSYNIHRLVIAGVTVASKFFSDVFYTNSRYAKVGGLPLAELNQLELQFLLLNNFNLVIPKDEMQRYAEQLILFSSNSAPGSLTISPAALTVAPSSSSSIAPKSSSGTPQPNDTMAPMHSMGAIDAYGGRIPGGESNGSISGSTQMTRPGTHRGTELNGNALSRVINPNQYQPHHALNGMVNGHGFASSSRLHRQEDSESETGEGAETETETETETEAETETDGGWTTDDEPTIRPAKSSAGSSSGSDAHSICSSVSESDSGEGDDEREDHIMDDLEDDDDEGARTPEHIARPEAVKDGEKTPERRAFRGRLGMSKTTTPTRRREHEHEQEMANP